MSNTVQESHDSQTAVADIATQLDEEKAHVVLQIERIIDHLGVATAYAFLDQTKQCLAEGGVLTHTCTR